MEILPQRLKQVRERRGLTQRQLAAILSVSPSTIALVWQECVNFIENPGEAIQELAATMEVRKSQRAALEAEKQKALMALNEKEAEKQSILDLYRKRIISSLDVEQQLQKITQERKALEERVRELDRQIAAEETLINQFNTAEELLADLRAKLHSDPPFQVRREIVRPLVKEIIVDTKPAENGRPIAVVTARYTFSKDVIRTARKTKGTSRFRGSCTSQTGTRTFY